MNEIYFRGERVVARGGVRPASIHVRGGVIVKVSAYEDVPAGAPIIDAGGLTIFPGVVDTHVHINEPGRTEWEGVESATRAAAVGGITTVVDMPLNSIPATTTASAVAVKVETLDSRSSVDIGLWGGAVPENTSGDANGLSKVLARGALGFKCFLLPSGVDEFPYVHEGDLRNAMLQLRGTGATLMVHSELEGPIEREARAMALEVPEADPRNYLTYLRSRPPQAEDDAVALLYRLCKEIGTPVHIVHLSSAAALTTLARARDEAVPLTAETAPHYLHFVAEQVPDGATWFKCAPPIRGAANRELLWQGLQDGLITMVVSDHSPCTPALKCTESGDFMSAWGGIAGLQFSLAAVMTEARSRGIPLPQVAEWMCAAPARHAGIYGKKGAIAAGFDADFVLLDEAGEQVVRAPFIHHRHKLSPYEGETLVGGAKATYLRGELIASAGSPTNGPKGTWIRRS